MKRAFRNRFNSDSKWDRMKVQRRSSLTKLTDPKAVTQPCNWCDKARTIAQILAVLFGGLWVLYKYRTVESPLLEPFLTIELQLSTKRATDNDEVCLVYLGAALQNKGKSPVTISNVNIQLWSYNRKLNGQIVEILDYSALHLEPPIWKSGDKTSIFTETYSPENATNYTFAIAVPKKIGRYLNATLQVSSPNREVERSGWSEVDLALDCEKSPVY
jgi:hypothetical protein